MLLTNTPLRTSSPAGSFICPQKREGHAKLRQKEQHLEKEIEKKNQEQGRDKITTMTRVKEYAVMTKRKRKDKTRQDKARQDKTRQDETRQDKTRRDKTRQGKAR